MKLASLFIALICAIAPLPSHAIVKKAADADVLASDQAFFEKSTPTLFQKKGNGQFSKAKLAAQIFKNRLFKPKKRRENGIDWKQEPVLGLLDVLFGAASLFLLVVIWGSWPVLLTILAISCSVAAVLIWLTSIFELRKKADRVPLWIGFALAMPVSLLFVAAILVAFYVIIRFGIWILRFIF